MKPDQFRPTTRRQRLVIVALTVAVVSGLWTVLILQPGFVKRDVPPCRGDQTRDCVGGLADVQLIAAPQEASTATASDQRASAASAPASASAASAVTRDRPASGA